MKKIISIILCVIISLSAFVNILVFASEKEDEWNGYPIILVPGYSSTVMINEETGEKVWGPDMDKILGKVLTDIAKLGIDLGVLAFGNAKMIADDVGQGFTELFEEMKCNPDGTSKYPIKRVRTTAEELQYSRLLVEDPDGEYQFEPEMTADLAEIVGNDNVFIFNSDFRMGSVACAGMLNDFIESVKEFTGKDKVNIFAVSHGGQTTATYVHLYGDKNDIAKAVLTIPAIGGAGIAYDIVADKVALDEESLLKYIEYGTCSETDFNWLVKAQQLGFLDDVIHYLIPYLYGVVQYWGSIWDFIPADKYDELKTLKLDETDNAALIETHDRFHYEIMPAIGESLRNARAKGEEISIIAGNGIHIMTGLDENSDGIITVNASTGATTAPFYTRFSDGYTQVNDCDGKYKVNPSMTVDASTAYLPDNTWFIEGYYHGMTYFDDYTKTLLYTLLTTDKIKDVYTSADYPQFQYARNTSLSVYAEFNGCQPGYIDKNATSLKVTNVSTKSIVTLQAVTTEGADLKFNTPIKVLKPGESVDISFTGVIPEVSKKEVDITICFALNTLTPQESRTQGFTIMNGDDCEYSDGFVNTNSTLLEGIIGESAAAFLKKIGLYDYFTMIYIIISSMMAKIF